MGQYNLSSTEAMPHSCAIEQRTQNYGIGGNERDCRLGDRISLKARASKTASVRRCWTRTRLWKRHRPRSKQAGTFHYAGMEGGLHAFA